MPKSRNQAQKNVMLVMERNEKTSKAAKTAVATETEPVEKET